MLRYTPICTAVMDQSSAVATRIRFGVFTLDVRTGELWKGPTRLKVPDQSIEILKTLVERRGELVTREELRERLWPSNHFVDFEHGLNAAIRRLRDALGDSADAPKFIETLPRRGYRFIGGAEVDAGTAAGGGHAVATTGRAAESVGAVLDPAQASGDTVPLPAAVAPSSNVGPGPASRRSIVILALAAATTAALVLAVWWLLTPRTAPSAPATALTRLTFDPGLQMNPTISPDGTLVAYASNKSGNFDIWIQSTTPGGQPRPVTDHPAHDWQPTWSPDGTQIVFRSERDGGGLFLMPTTGGREKRICDFGYEPRWSPDGTRVLFSELALRGAGRGEVYTLGTRAGSRPVLVDLTALSRDERVGPSVGWHPDARRVTFFNIRVVPGGRILQVVTIDVEQGTATRSKVDQHVNDTLNQYSLLNARGDLVWAPHARALYFIGDYFGVESIWMLDVDPLTLAVTGGPHRVTGTSEDNEGLSLSHDGRRLVFGAAHRKARVALHRLDPSGNQIVGAPEFITGEEVHARAPDLTRDGSRLVFALFRPSGGARRTELLERPLVGSAPERLLLENDGTVGEARTAPRWSPDGRYIAYAFSRRTPGGSGAEPGRVRSLVLFDTETLHEEQLTSPIAATPNTYEVAYGWSTDGRHVISSTDRHTPGVVSIVLVPIDARPTADKASVPVTENRKYMPWNTTMSPDTRWICFNSTDATQLGGGSRIAVVPSGGGAWKWMTGTDSWADKPRWSADGLLIYYISRQGGYFNVWAIGFDPVTGAAVDKPFQLTHFDGPGQQIPPSLGEVELGVGGGRLAIPVISPKGGIWMLENVSR